MTQISETSENLEDLHARAMAAAGYIHSVARIQPKLGLILGSGLGDFAESVQDATVIPYSEIPNFPISTVAGHSGQLVLGRIGDIPVAVMQGRVHAYEGYSMKQVTFPTRVLGLLGVERLIITNAAGGINPGYGQGAIVALADHINLTGTNALIGPNEPRFGDRFFDMTHAYSPAFRKLAIEEASKQGWKLEEGVYVAVLGPSYETPAEIRAFRILGGDLVGMSTVHEVIAARHMGIEILGLSIVTNMAAGVLDQPINHEEVMETGKRIAGQFTSLLTALIPQLVTQPATS
ncbi:purine-nucleoside phosphorylase [Edaphobacter sp. HDX4]|uniref:purine-nucleoside phosphorylase n=1 Tax=Edaphobacter sp. HDX4 TaxID=2794064 RepID=UPI002FE56C0D